MAHATDAIRKRFDALPRVEIEHGSGWDSEVEYIRVMIGACPRCRNERANVRYDLGAARIVRCADCGLMYLDPWPSREAIEAVYGDTYFENQGFLSGDNDSLFGYADYIAERFNKQLQYASIARTIRALLPPMERAPSLLEVGCGLGYFLSEAFDEGFDVSGIEFNASAVERTKRKYAFPVRHGALESVSLNPGSVDAVTMFDVIEHLRDPFACLDKIYDVLTPGGVIALSTPDAESFVSRVLAERLEDFRRTREHLFFFSRKTLTEILREHGFDVLSIRSIGHTFELSFLLDRLQLYNRPIFKAVQRLIEGLGMGSLQIRVNPLTKMLIVARKTGSRPFRPAARARPAIHAMDSASELDWSLVDELESLDAETPRHYQWIAELIAPHLGRRVLEVGSGVGVISKFLIPRSEHLILSDHQEVFLERLRDRFGPLPNVRYQMLDLAQPPYDLDGESIDTVVCMNTLEHLEDDARVLRGFHALLPHAGRLVLQVPNFPSLFGSLDTAYGHRRRYSPDMLRLRLEDAGFRVTALRRLNPFAIPGWFLAGKILRQERLSVPALRVYDQLVPLFRRIDFASRVTGLALLACAEKR